jgi:hypothetical protein
VPVVDRDTGGRVRAMGDVTTPGLVDARARQREGNLSADRQCETVDQHSLLAHVEHLVAPPCAFRRPFDERG